VASGVEPVHFCVVLVFALAIGLFTPPVGTTLIISSYIAKAPVLAVARQCLPFLAMMIGLLFLVVLIPDLALWLPRTLFGP